jgi:hypothetical protein
MNRRLLEREFSLSSFAAWFLFIRNRVQGCIRHCILVCCPPDQACCHGSSSPTVTILGPSPHKGPIPVVVEAGSDQVAGLRPVAHRLLLYKQDLLPLRCLPRLMTPSSAGSSLDAAGSCPAPSPPPCVLVLTRLSILRVLRLAERFPPTAYFSLRRPGARLFSPLHGPLRLSSQPTNRFGHTCGAAGLYLDRPD